MKRLVFALLVLGGCRQGEGERCQVTSDCSDGLVCNTATLTCASDNKQQLDAHEGTPIDGPVNDAPTDAAIDAMPLADAAVTDAAAPIDAAPDAP